MRRGHSEKKKNSFRFKKKWLRLFAYWKLSCVCASSFNNTHFYVLASCVCVYHYVNCNPGGKMKTNIFYASSSISTPIIYLTLPSIFSWMSLKDLCWFQRERKKMNHKFFLFTTFFSFIDLCACNFIQQIEYQAYISIFYQSFIDKIPKRRLTLNQKKMTEVWNYLDIDMGDFPCGLCVNWMHIWEYFILETCIFSGKFHIPTFKTNQTDNFFENLFNFIFLGIFHLFFF